MDAQPLQYLAATLYIARFPLAAAAFVFCILLLRRTQNLGWLLLGLIFLEPFCALILRVIYGRRLLPYSTVGGPVVYGIPTMNINLDVPLFNIIAVIGLYLIFRGTNPGKHD